ncbi:GntR family transcriptional regulator [Gracilibacillus oryzae]|uniref:GntR family transcriptional regulator n=1 Tax=Gracilibacillus oryzae TaxID=1672701 RepID=A0A7C8KYW0_9BACI|nr:GntR family transcriptional regulator [Gracilibacillus oryzae]KAB8137613.1 GntR family transcriptional regulator [Gracilibacillus oryzae]
MEAKYKRIKNLIKSDILSGLTVPHQKISSENELMRQFNVSRHTVRLAIGELVSEGWLYREQGAGTFCADRTNLKDAEVVDEHSEKNIAIVTTFISEYIFPSIIRGAEAYLSEQGYRVSIFNTNNQYQIEREILDKILLNNYAGVIIEPANSSAPNPNLKYYLNLEREKIPYVMINAVYDELEPVSFMMDDIKGGYMQTKHLIELGHKDIVCIYKTDDSQGRKRLKGFIKAHRESNLTLNPQNIITYTSGNEMTEPVRCLSKLLDNKYNKPTAVVCYNDQLVMRVMDYIRKKGLCIPEDLSIVGYDDSILAEVSEVKLTSVIHPKQTLGWDAAKAVTCMIKKKSMKDKKLSCLYEPELNIRQSTLQLSEKLLLS